MASLWLDLRHALRIMLRAPGLTAVLVITLALGVGATTTIFSVVHSVVLRPLPYREPDRLVRLHDHVIGKAGLPELDRAIGQIADLARRCDTCAGIAAWRERSASLAGGDRPVRARTVSATHTLQPLLGVAPLVGRWFDAKEDQPGDPQVVVLGYDLWQRAFAGDPRVVGRTVHLDAMPVTVVGVMPAGFRFPDRAELYVPSRIDYTHTDEGSFNDAVIARLADGASLEAFRAELAARSRSWTES